jgi:chromosome segregation ATPase
LVVSALGQTRSFLQDAHQDAHQLRSRLKDVEAELAETKREAAAAKGRLQQAQSIAAQKKQEDGPKWQWLHNQLNSEKTRANKAVKRVETVTRELEEMAAAKERARQKMDDVKVRGDRLLLRPEGPPQSME